MSTFARILSFTFLVATSGCTDGQVDRSEKTNDSKQFFPALGNKTSRSGVTTDSPQEEKKAQDTSALPVAPLNPPFSDPFVSHQFHNVSDLLFRNCSVAADPFGLKCRSAVNLACQALGYAGGGGIVEIGKAASSGLCINKSVGEYVEIPYANQCTHSQHSSIHCDSLAQRTCVSRGFATSSGVVSANPSVVGTFCLPSALSAAVNSNFAEIVAANPSVNACNRESALANESTCDHNASRACRTRGFELGFGVVEASDSNAIISCVRTAKSVSFQLAEPTWYEKKAIKIGENIAGGFVAPGLEFETIQAEAIVNKFPFPVLVRKVEYGHNYEGPRAYSRDSCLFLNRGFIGQFDDNDDGEVGCVYSDEKESPTQDFKDLGLILYPGEQLIFQGTPQWGKEPDGTPHAVGSFAWAKIQVSKMSPDTIPVRRVRFPQYDTITPVGTEKVRIDAGNTSEFPPVVKTAPEKPLRNSNRWYVNPSDTHIRGMTIFMSLGQPAGIQSVSACLRVVQQGGLDLAPPKCMTLSDDKFGPHTFNRVFGADQNGSALLRFDRFVPAGALIGIDFEYSTETPTNLDFAGYVWLEK